MSDRQGTFTVWGCAFCGKKETTEPSRNREVFDAIIPKGWAWAKYISARRGKEERVLGCSPDHARVAATSFCVPDEIKNITITKIQE